MPPGEYEGKALVELLDDGRRVQLKVPFSYIDPRGRSWPVREGAIVDGASIPRLLWTLIGGPFEGKYRNASIIHDWYCDVRMRSWQDTHRMFFEAMLTSSVSAKMARLLYAGVYLGGPRWSKTVVENTRLVTKHVSPAKREPNEHAAKGTYSRKRYTETTRKTVTHLVKYRVNDNDIDWLQQLAEIKDLDVKGIERLVDERLEPRKPDVRKLK